MTDYRSALLEQARLLLQAGEVPRGPVRSPCLSVCRMETTNGLCEGCLRTLDEIGEWSDLDNTGRLAVWQRIARRAQATPDAGPDGAAA